MRFSAYTDAQLRRVGPNNLFIPVNNPETNKNVKVCTCQRNGFMQIGACPAHNGNSHNRHFVIDQNAHVQRGTFESGVFGRHMLLDEDDYSQARNFYRVCIFVGVVSY